MSKHKSNQRRHLINKKVLKRQSKQSNIVKHAIKELTIAGYFNDNSCGPNKWMREQVIELLTVFASHGNSGSSAPWEIDLFSKLANFEIISPLTFEDKEWNVIDDDGSCQNNRCSHIFKDKDGKINDIYAFNKKFTKQYLFGNTAWTSNPNPITYSGALLFEIDENDICTGRAFNRCRLYYIDSIKPYIPKKTKTLNCKEVEISKDSWMSFINKDSTDLLLLNCDYDIDWKISNHIKDKHCITLTDEDEKIAYDEIKNNK